MRSPTNPTSHGPARRGAALLCCWLSRRGVMRGCGERLGSVGDGRGRKWGPDWVGPLVRGCCKHLVAGRHLRMFGLLTITAIALNTTDKASSSILSEVAAALAVDANATAPFYIGCYRDCISGTNCDKRDLPVFWCSNGKDGLGDCAADSALPAGASAYASGSAMTMATCSGMCTGF
eukprot:6690507-Prymnesium_polylepis.1